MKYLHTPKDDILILSINVSLEQILPLISILKTRNCLLLKYTNNEFNFSLYFINKGLTCFILSNVLS